MVVIPPGTFMMGSTEAEREWVIKQGAPAHWGESEKPQHRVKIEPAADRGHAELRLTLFPDGGERLLAHADFHGRWVRWLTS